MKITLELDDIGCMYSTMVGTLLASYERRAKEGRTIYLTELEKVLLQLADQPNVGDWRQTIHNNIAHCKERYLGE